MKSLFNLVAFAALLIILGILMYFVIYTENFDNDVREEKIVNQDLLSHSIMLQDNASEQYESVLNENSLANSIKYSEGMKWDKWVRVDGDVDVLTVITNKVKQYIINRGIDLDIIFCKLNRYKNALFDKECILLDYDVVLYDETKQHADHGKLLCVFENKRGVDIVHYRIVGRINEDYIYMRNNATTNSDNKSYSSFNQMNRYVGDFIDSDDTCDSMRTHDEQIKKLLYNKIMNETISDVNDVDYMKNKEHNRAHKIVRNMFMNGLKGSPSISDHASRHKNYPYKGDFTIL